MLLWNHNEASRLPCVGSDNFEAGRLIGEHVAGLGHREVVCLFPPLSGNDRATQRFAGVSAALATAGVSLGSDKVLETPYSVTSAKSAVAELLANGPGPTALIGGNDVLAWGAMHAASRLGIPVPGDLTVTGIGDFAGSRDFEPALTTVRIPARQIGRRAGEALARAIVASDEPVASELIAPELIPRSTSSVPRGDHGR